MVRDLEDLKIKGRRVYFNSFIKLDDGSRISEYKLLTSKDEKGGKIIFEDENSYEYSISEELLADCIEKENLAYFSSAKLDKKFFVSRVLEGMLMILLSLFTIFMSIYSRSFKLSIIPFIIYLYYIMYTGTFLIHLSGVSGLMRKNKMILRSIIQNKL